MKNKLPVAAKKISKPIPVKVVSDPSPMAEEKQWRVQDALRDIERAEAHKKDKALMKEVKKLASEKMNALKKIC